MSKSDVMERILEALRVEPTFLCALATMAEDGRPSVRTMRATIDEDLTIRCPTFLGADKVKQIRARPEVHVTCGSTDSDRPGSYFRIEGRAEISTDPSDRQLAWNDRLEKWFSGFSDPNYAVVKIVPYRIVAHPISGGPDAQAWETQAPVGTELRESTGGSNPPGSPVLKDDRSSSSTAQSHRLLSQTTIDSGVAKQLPSCSANGHEEACGHASSKQPGGYARLPEQPIIVRQTLLDDTDDGGGISEPSSQRMEEQLRSNYQATQRSRVAETLPRFYPG